MKNNFYKLNFKYIENFSRSVFDRFRKENIKTDRSFLKVLFMELNRLFKYLGSRVSSKYDIPGRTDYPDSDQFNKLLEDIAIDIDKLYTAQKLVEDDINNLMNFNSTQRLRTFNNLTSTQQKVYSTYIKNKTTVGGEIVIPSENPFRSADNLDDESTGVSIEETRTTLTLAHETSIVKPVNLDHVKVFFSNNLLDDSFNIYPNSRSLGIGSHWKIAGQPEAHHINRLNKTDADQYKKMLIDDPNNNLGIGWCEFESVKTFIPDDEQETKVEALKNLIGETFSKDAELYLDAPNSLQGEFVSSLDPGNRKHKYKLTIPFSTDAPLTNELAISFEPNANGYYPEIDWRESRIFSNREGTDQAYRFITPIDRSAPENGEYRLIIKDGYVKPARAEIVLKYGSDNLQWIPFKWFMSYYVYFASKNYVLPQSSFGNVSLVLSKTYDIFVDAEPDKQNEKTRALKVLLLRGEQ